MRNPPEMDPDCLPFVVESGDLYGTRVRDATGAIWAFFDKQEEALEYRDRLHKVPVIPYAQEEQLGGRLGT